MSDTEPTPPPNETYSDGWRERLGIADTDQLVIDTTGAFEATCLALEGLGFVLTRKSDTLAIVVSHPKPIPIMRDTTYDVLLLQP